MAIIRPYGNLALYNVKDKKILKKELSVACEV